MAENKDLLDDYIDNEYSNVLKSEYISEKNIDKDEIILTYGESAENEDFIVGNEKGLKNLIYALEEALEKGESTNYNLSDLSVGIRKVSTLDYDEENDKGSYFSDFIGYSVLFIILSVFVTGFVTIVKWFF